MTREHISSIKGEKSELPEALLLSSLMSKEELRQWAGSTIFARGEHYFISDRVLELKLFYYPDHGRAEALVGGNEIYNVRVKWNAEGRIGAACTCPFAGEAPMPCKHEVAVILAIMEKEHHGDVHPVWEEDVESLLQEWRTNRRKPRKGTPIASPYYLAFVVAPLPSGYLGYYRRPVLFPLTPFYYPLPQGSTPSSEGALQLLEGHYGDWKEATRPLPNHQCANLPPEVVGLANGLILLRSKAPSYADAYYHTSDGLLREFSTALLSLRAMNAHHLIPLGLVIEGHKGERKLTALRFWPAERPLNIHLRLKSSKEHFTLSPSIGGGEQIFSPRQVRVLWDTPFPVVALADQWLVLLDDPEQNRAWAFLQHFSRQIHIPKSAQSRFLERYFPEILREIGVEDGELRIEDRPPTPPQPRLYLQEDEEHGLAAELRFAYGEREVPYDPKSDAVLILPTEQPWVYQRLYRDLEAERERHHQAASATFGLKRGPKEHPERLLLRKRVHPIDFLMEKVPKLAQAGFEIYGEENLTKHRVNRHVPTVRVQVNSGLDWFDLQVEVAFGDQVVSLKEVLQALKRKKRYVKLADGTMGTIPEEWLQRYKHLFDLAEVTDDEHLRVADYHAALVEEILEDEETQVRAAQDLRDRIRSLENVHAPREVPLPKGLQGKLRPYQVAGYRWLHFLHDNRFGGILADDMGLGKTVQVLAFLLSLRESGHAQKADLLVVPRSLLVNWQREVEKFTPSLRVLPYFGPARPEVEAFDEYDLVLTTYGVMRVDVNKLRAYRFHYIVLDESQAIKNPLSKTARAARKLQAEHRLALTGTPVENTTFELWSQMAFVMPGLLGGMDYFKENFASPIERQQDETTAQRLRRLIYPFILRRTKEQVAPELPPRTERVVYCDMGPAQRHLYEKTRDAYRAMLLGLIDEEGLDKARMKVLEGLLRLRQIANHPRLVKANYRGTSSKMETLMETLETLAAEGHKALVFSQFVQMLKLVRQDLEKRNLAYVYLDGSTTDRQTPIDRFQNDPVVPFFLISLRAGGLGLNLTAADYVVHIDPWWNPAVERQATGRTHRIGQDKPVFVYKLITRETVEEKILQLQEQKKALVEQLITAESRFFKELTPDDVRALFS